MHVIAVLNPAAAHWQAGKKRRIVEAALRGAGFAGAVWVTEGPEHAVELARQAAAEADAVLAVGGDGTIHEVCRGLIESAHQTPLGVIPMGTGNDFAKMLGMDGDPAVAARQLATARRVAIDYGVVRWEEDGAGGAQPFVNAVGVGLDARAAFEANALKHLPGLASYVAAIFRTLVRWEFPQVRITAAPTQGEAFAVLYDGALLLATAGNGVSSGGAFYLTPRATVTDGLLDVCIAEKTTLLRILALLPRALKGRHEHEPEIVTSRAHALHVAASEGVPVHADGEVLALRAHAVDVEVVPGGLSVLMAS